MKKILTLAFTLATLILTVACTKEAMPVPTHKTVAQPTVVINPSTHYVSADGDKVMTEIRTKNSESWVTPYEVDYESLPDWIEVTETYIDHFNYRILPNDTKKDRKATFTIIVDGRRVPITVEQNTIKVNIETINTPIGVHWTLSVMNEGENPVKIVWDKVQLEYYFNRNHSMTDLKPLFEDRILEANDGYYLTRSFANNNFECGNIKLEYYIKDKKYTKGLTL